MAITDDKAALRIAEVVDRWHHFIGRATSRTLAESRTTVHGDGAHEHVEEVGLGQ
jgi:hypothetical protein